MDTNCRGINFFNTKFYALCLAMWSCILGPGLSIRNAKTSSPKLFAPPFFFLFKANRRRKIHHHLHTTTMTSILKEVYVNDRNIAPAKIELAF